MVIKNDTKRRQITGTFARLGLAAGAIALACITPFAVATAADYPEKPVTLVSPYGAGGAADLAARALASNVTRYLGTNMIVTNRAGAGGITGSAFVAKSPADGYTLLLARVGSQAAVPAINRKLPYTWDGFTFLGMLEKSAFAMTVAPNSRFKSIADIKAALEKGEKVSYASTGVGTLLHLGTILMLDEMGVPAESARHVPFKGGGEAVSAVAGGHVDLLFQNLSGVIGPIQGGQLRALAVTSTAREATLKDVPTMREAGLPGLESVVGWSALYGPPDLPAPIVKKWVDVLGQIKNDKPWIQMTEKLESTPSIESPEATKAFVRNQYEKFKSVVDRLGIAIN